MKELTKAFELATDVGIEESVLRQKLNTFLQDFTYNSHVTVLDAMDGQEVFVGYVSEYFVSDVKNKDLYVELIEVVDGKVVFKVL